MMELFSENIQIENYLFGRPLASDIWVMIIIAVIVASFFLYRREKGIKLGVRMLLMSVRIAIILLVVCGLFEPTAAVKETRREKRTLAVLIDSSQSMSIRDQRKRPEDIKEAAIALGFFKTKKDEPENKGKIFLNTKQKNAIAGASRLDYVKKVLTKTSSTVFKALSKDLDVRYYAFGETKNMLGDGKSDPSEEINKLKAIRQGTSLAGTVENIANAHRDKSLSGIIVLSDGIDTTGRQPEAVAHDLGARGIPIYTIPTGIPDPDDIAIRNVIVQDVVFVGDTVPLKVQIRSKGYEKRTTDLIVKFNQKEVATKEIVLEGGLQYIEIDFDARIRSKRAVELEVEVKPFIDEATPVNNKVIKSIRVVNEKINVLCIEGSARWEFRYLRAILKRDPRIRTTFIATRAGNDLAMQSSEYIARFPEDPEEAFKYDLVILGDVDSAFFTSGELSRLEQLIKERGASLLMLAGPKYSPTSYGGTVIENILPVRFNPKDKWHDVSKNVYPILTSEGRSSLVLTLEHDKNKNDRIWTHAAPLDRLPPLLDARPGATVLAELSDNGARVGGYPLISWHRYGTGKCMLMATDRLWRLRFRTGDKYHWRVWSQCIQFLTLSRLMGEHKQIRMETDRVSYPIGEQVRIYAEVLDEGYDPVIQENYNIYITTLNEDEDDSEENIQQQKINLRPDATRPGLYEGYFTPPTAGRYKIEATEDDLDFANSLEFQVADIKPEMANTDMQITRLQKMSTLSGGKSLKFSQIGELDRVLDKSLHEIVIRRELPLWDNWIFAFIIIALTGIEWIVRRRCDLL